MDEPLTARSGETLQLVDLRMGRSVRETAPMPIVARPSVSVATIAADLSDSAADRRIYLAAGGLVLLGVVMTIATAWWWHATRPDDPALGPLEVMSRKRWATADPAEQARLLASARPAAPASTSAGGDAAQPAAVTAAVGAAPAVIDLRRASAAPLPAIDDLRVEDDAQVEPGDADEAGDDNGVGDDDGGDGGASDTDW